MTSTNIARILNLYPRKGSVEVGADADLVVWDPKARKTISAAAQVSAIDYNVFEGVACEGLPRTVLSRGDVAFHDGKVLAEPGRGRFVPRAPFTPEAQALRRWRGAIAPKPVAR